jgi:hypothetical protein
MALAYANAYLVMLDASADGDAKSIPTFYQVVESFRNHLRLKGAYSEAPTPTALARGGWGEFA